VTAPWRIGVLALGILVLTTACSQTRYVEIPSDRPDEPTATALARTVEFRQDDELLMRPPSCFLIVGKGTERIAPELAELIEQSLARHVQQRARRVLAGAARDQQARRFGVSAIDAANADYVATRAGCDGIIEYEVTDAEARYLVFYTRLSMALDIRARRAGLSADLWRARHASAMSSGGPPTSVASVVSIWSATELAGDDEAAAGLVEEIVRRVMATWPIAKRPA
jgi:hypothetical protein